MKQTIYKYAILDFKDSIIKMPKSSKILHFDNRGGMHIWAQVDLDDKETVVRKFIIYGTGMLLPDNPGVYVGTAFDGPFVWHLYEKTLSD